MTDAPSRSRRRDHARAAAILALSCFTALGSGCERSPSDGDGLDDFRLPPYLQHPTSDAMTVLWLSPDLTPGRLAFHRVGAEDWRTLVTDPTPTPVLADAAGRVPARHRVRLTGLMPDTLYAYVVTQGRSRVRSQFRTAPAPSARQPQRPIRIIAMGDCEAEPESTGKHAPWPDPSGRVPGRRYLLDQTEGLARNLAVVTERRPDLILIAGDLVESGGEPQDWDELWRHLGLGPGGSGLAARVPVLPAPGNHEYYAGDAGGYDQPASEAAIQRYLGYFEVPDNHAPDPAHHGRYYRLDYGPVTIISLDVANDSPHRSDRDTNFYLTGEADPGGGHAPGFGPGSRQARWLERQLRDAQARAAFVIVMFHHVPYSVGPHGWPPGPGTPAVPGGNGDPQSGVPVRALTPLFLRYGVDLVVAGHDEMFERSELNGHEHLPGGGTRPHLVQVYDVGVCGDGLRGPQLGLTNPYQRFLAHRDAPETWRDGRLVGGGVHYGHLELDLAPDPDHPRRWQVELEPVYVLPIFPAAGADPSRADGHLRRVYDDVLRGRYGPPTAPAAPATPDPALASSDPE
ncbi:metallophosphoesterase [Haliangium sp.]|uniref:metallophosphoesterase n=1 Tax=Haliangium sp. TaxID=2663208 RepID=UPI003D0BC648